MSQNPLALPTTGTVSGLTMVQDMNAALDTLNTCASGGSAPSSPEDCQFWADTTNNLLKQWDATNSVWQILAILRSPSANFVHGGCKLTVASTTSLSLIPYNGNGLIVNGVPCIIPSGGVSLSNSGLSASTVYYIYATQSVGVISLVASATGHSTSSNGVETMSSDVTKTLVGMICTNGSSQFVDSLTAGRTCLSWFNQKLKPILPAPGSNSTSSTTLVSLSTSPSFLTWADQAVSFNVDGYMGNATAATFNRSNIYFDTALTGGSAVANISTASTNFPFSCSAVNQLSEGVLHTSSLYGLVSGGNGTWNFCFAGAVMG